MCVTFKADPFPHSCGPSKLKPAQVLRSVSNSGQNFKTRVSGFCEKKPGQTRFYFGFWNERAFEW